MSQIMLQLLDSWSRSEGNVNKTADLLAWIQELNATTRVDIEQSFPKSL